jgi:ketosteroid isomerase-like protein
MSQENVEIVRAAIAAYNRGAVDAVFRDAAPDAELDWSRAHGPYRGVYRLDQFRSFLGDFRSTFESVRFEAHEFLDSDEDVVVPFTGHLGGRDGIEATASGVIVCSLRDGLIVRACLYQEKQEALEAAGLSE